MTKRITRRRMLTGAGAAVLAGAVDGCSVGGLPPRRLVTSAILDLPRLRARPDRITRITVCTRPFRAEGPRIEAERIGDKTVIHNYGHGGSGWSLSWGSSSIAVDLAMATGERDVAVVGCGALGLTSATLLQRAGARVTIYAKELPPNVRSSYATGVWTPDSRICFEEHATPAFKQRWERMARHSFETYQSLLGLPGTPIEYTDLYFASDDPPTGRGGLAASDARPRFAELQRELVPDLMPNPEVFAPGSHPLGRRRLARTPSLMFNLVAYSHLLLTDFVANGGRIEIAEFRTPADFARLQERTLIHATGYGARTLFGDRSVIPVRGQLARTAPEPGIDYGIIYPPVVFVPRRDGFVFQVIGDNDYYGFDDDRIEPDRAEAELAINTIVGLFTPG